MFVNRLARVGALLLAGGALAAAAVALAQPEAGAPGVAGQKPLIAIIDGVALSRDVLSSSEFAEERDERGAALDAELQSLVAELQRSQVELQTMDRASPQFQSKVQEFQTRQREAEQMRTNGLGELNRITARQLAIVYTRVNEAAREEAEAQGYSYVMSSTALPDPAAGMNFEDVRGTIQSRQMLVFPEGAEITAAVRTRLGVEAVAVGGAGAEEAGAGEAPEGQGAAPSGGAGGN